VTTKRDSFDLRVDKIGEGAENSLGVAQDGMQDPTGEYPKREYNYGSSINKASRGTKINNLYVGGGDIGVSLNIEPQRPSEYPFNQVQETVSGHVIEQDDTPGGERVLIKHRTGAGVEMRADGSVIISAVNNKIEVTGGDQTVIIEGNGNLVYQGNLNLKVTGDYNVDVGGNYNVNVAGSLREDILENHKTTVTGNRELTTKKTKTTRTLGTSTDVMLADYNSFVKLDQKNFVEGNMEFASEDNIFMSGKEAFVVSSKNANITGAKYISIMGQKGAIGGRMVDFTGNVFQGGEGPVEYNSGAVFYGTFMGKASEAWKANNADNADLALRSYFASNAKHSLTAVTAGTAATGAATFSIPKILSAGIHLPKKTKEFQYPSSGPAEVQITGEWVVGQAVNGDYAIKTVVLDGGDVLLAKTLLTDDYNDVFNKIPTTQEIRSAFRNASSRDSIGSVLVSEERLNPEYKSKSPPKVGRTAKKSASSRFGFEPIGNAIENRGKRFTP
jgi:hypothetical protein|tara:strand:+ start:4380 stop:5882 length:1503 start_codon:yes stop_codon:yes gene_type:complete